MTRVRNRMVLRLLGAVLALSGLNAAGGEANGCRCGTRSVALRIINGTNAPASQFPTVGQVGSGNSLYCTGTLISPQHVLTAAHCFSDDNGQLNVAKNSGRLRLKGVDYFTKDILIHPTYNREINTDGIVDLAVLVLENAVPGVTPSPLNRATPTVGSVLTIAGYGFSGTGTSGVTPTSTAPASGTIDFGTTPIDQISRTYLQWNFDSTTPEESNTAPGDSGGPAFVTVDGQLLLAGVTSGGSLASAMYGDRSFDTRVDAALPWLDSILTHDPNAPPPPGFTSGPTFSPTSPVPLQDVTFSATPPDGRSVTWDFGDGTQAVGGTVTHRYASLGTFTIQVTASGTPPLASTLALRVKFPDAVPLAFGRSKFALNFKTPERSSMDMRFSSSAFIVEDRYEFEARYESSSIAVFLGETLLDTLQFSGRKGTGLGVLAWNAKKGEIGYRLKGLLVRQLLATYGATDSTVERAVKIPFTISLKDGVYFGTHLFLYGAKAGKSGLGK